MRRTPQAASRFPLLPPLNRSCAAHARLTPLAASLAACFGASIASLAWGQAVPAAPAASAPGIELRLSPELKPLPRGDAGRQLPVIVQAQEIRGRPDLETVAEGNVEFRRGGVVIRSDRLTYEQLDDLATARGNVRISRDGNRYAGPEAQLKIQRFEGYFLNPSYYFARTGAGGTAQRVDFIDEQRSIASGATYTSCTPDGTGTPAWLLSTDRVTLDFATNEGIADGAVLRFLGVPILAAPRLSFPLTDERKSGWLPPSFGLDSKSGLQVAVPYYWNIAPNRDATFTPQISTRRGVGLESEFRYLEPRDNGEVKLNLLPFDLITRSTRYAFTGRQESEFGNGARFDAQVQRVSDNDYWKDFARGVPSLTPRLLASDYALSRPFGDWDTYARVKSWQVLQTTDATSRIEAPYDRLPQIGARYWKSGLWGGVQVGFEGEFNRFVNPTDPSQIVGANDRLTGNRVHALGSISRPFGTPGWTLTPRLSFNAASYALDQPLADGRTSASRVIPTFSVDSAWVLERETSFFGRAVRQTLEPRLFYVNTPYHDQSVLPNFDASAKDFNFDSIFTENAFSGVDRVSDAHQLTAGVTTRYIDSDTGAELLRLGIAQRYLIRDQRVTPDGQTLTRRFSDVLLLGSTTLVPSWALDASLQYSPDSNRIERSIVGVRYSPGPYRTLSATYRLTRGLSEQVELGWQWPIYGPTPDESRGAARRGGEGGGSCRGSWYAVGRINYSTLEKRMTDSVAGFEYDAGCWIGRVVAERLSTGRSEATTRLLIQLELVGLSRLGSNPLQVLKDNIPGYRLLRDERAPAQPMTSYD